jgi:hypothetical protein
VQVPYLNIAWWSVTSGGPSYSWAAYINININISFYFNSNAIGIGAYKAQFCAC